MFKCIFLYEQDPLNGSRSKEWPTVVEVREVREVREAGPND